MTTKTTNQVKPLFSLGQIEATPSAILTMQDLSITPGSLLTRHLHGDWQDMDKEDQESNQEAIEQSFRVFSAYIFGDVKFWVITEADRSSTTILLPEEY